MKKRRQCIVCGTTTSSVCGLRGCSHLACADCWRTWLLTSNHCLGKYCHRPISQHLTAKLRIRQARRAVKRNDEWMSCPECEVKVPKPVSELLPRVKQRCPACSQKIELDTIQANFSATRCNKCGLAAYRISGCSEVRCHCGNVFYDNELIRYNG